MIKKIGRILLLLLLTGFSACNSAPDCTISLTDNLINKVIWPPSQSQPAGWKIGFDVRMEPKDDVRQVASLADWLRTKTGLPFTVDIPSTADNIVAALCNGKVDLAVVGTVSYLQAKEQCGASILVRGRSLEDQDNYRAAIVVPFDSPLKTLQNLRGHTFAFGAINSTQGNLIPRIMLKKSGLTLEDFKAYTYTKSHNASANEITSRRYDAGAIQDTFAINLAERGLVRILAVSEPYPSSGIVAGPQVPQQTISLVQQALLQLDPTGADASALYQWERTEMPHGFVLAKDDEYERLQYLARSIGILK